MVNKQFFIVVGLMLVGLGSSAQSSTVTVREAWSTPYSTTYWINTYPSTSTYDITLPTSSPDTYTKWNQVYEPNAVRGSQKYENYIKNVVTLFNKSDKTPDEYDQLRQYAYGITVYFGRVKDERLREFYRFHCIGALKLCNIFGDEPADITEQY